MKVDRQISEMKVLLFSSLVFSGLPQQPPQIKRRPSGTAGWGPRSKELYRGLENEGIREIWEILVLEKQLMILNMLGLLFDVLCLGFKDWVKTIKFLQECCNGEADKLDSISATRYLRRRALDPKCTVHPEWACTSKFVCAPQGPKDKQRVWYIRFFLLGSSNDAQLKIQSKQDKFGECIGCQMGLGFPLSTSLSSLSPLPFLHFLSSPSF